MYQAYTLQYKLVIIAVMCLDSLVPRLSPRPDENKNGGLDTF